MTSVDLRYMAEKFFVAVDHLATSSTANLQERLLYAWTDGLIQIGDDDLPAPIAARFQDLRTAMRRWGTSNTSARAMSDEEARDLIGRIISLYGEIREAEGHHAEDAVTRS